MSRSAWSSARVITGPYDRDEPRLVVAELEQQVHGVDAAADPCAGEIIECGIAFRRCDVADGDHVGIAEKDIDVAVGVRLDQVAVVDPFVAGFQGSRRVEGLSWTRRYRPGFLVALLGRNKVIGGHP